MRDTRTIRGESPWDIYQRLLAAAEITDPAEPDLAPYAANARLRHRVPLPVAVFAVIAVLVAAVKLVILGLAVIYLLGALALVAVTVFGGKRWRSLESHTVEFD